MKAEAGCGGSEAGAGWLAGWQLEESRRQPAAWLAPPPPAAATVLSPCPSPLPELAPPPLDDVSMEIARNVAALIPNGACLQMVRWLACGG